MKLFDFLFKKSTLNKNKKDTNKKITHSTLSTINKSEKLKQEAINQDKELNRKPTFRFLSEGIVHIEEPSLVACGNYSINKKYFAASSEGNLVLIDCEEKQIKYVKNLFHSILYPYPIPTNDGYVELFDAPKEGQLFSVYYVISPDGQIIVKQEVNAFIQNSYLSHDRTVACFQTANNYEHEDGNKLFIVDVENNKILNKWSAPTGWADSFELDTQNRIILLKYKDGSQYQYTFSGQLLDQEKWEKERLAKLNGYQLINEANEEFALIESSGKKVDIHSFESVINLLKTAVDKDISPYQKALAYRRLGEIYLRFNYKKEALENFNKAVHFNPKVGVKKKISQLQKELDN